MATEKAEVLYFPKMCCGEPIVAIQKFSGARWMECRVSGEKTSICNNGNGISASKFDPYHSH